MKDKELSIVKKVLSTVSPKELSIAYSVIDNYCPNRYGLENATDCHVTCNECWRLSLENINLDNE